MNTVTQSIVTHFGASLDALYRYGRQELPRFRSDEVHLLAVVSNTEILLNDYKVPFLKKIHSLQVFTSAELNRSLDVFPLEFLDMKLDRELIVGTDVLASIEVAIHNVRHQAEFSLRSTLLRARQAALLTPKDQRGVVGNSASDVVRSLRGLLNMLHGKALKTPEEVVLATEEWTSKALPILRNLLESDRPGAIDFSAYRKEIEVLVDRIDAL